MRPFGDEELLQRAQELRGILATRRSVRSFDPRPIPLDVVQSCIDAAASAPSGANMQPWSFVLVQDPAVKRAIREASEAVEKEFYARKISEEWKSRLAPLRTGPQKPFLEEAPYLVCVFVQRHGIDAAGQKITHYYPLESVGIATGLLIASLHLLGISTLTYTPSPMGFLTELLRRPPGERPFMILVVGYPRAGYEPPPLARKGRDGYLTVV
jgi:nitroreductase